MATITGKHIYRTANLLIQQHGDEAEHQAATHQRKRRKRCDADGAEVLEPIITAFGVVRPNEPDDGKRVH